MTDEHAADIAREARRRAGRCRWCGMLRINEADWASSYRCPDSPTPLAGCSPDDNAITAARDRLAALEETH